MPVSLSGSVLITGSITTSGTITAQTLVVQTITASIVQMTGSNTFGSLSTDRQTFTGSMYVTGSFYLSSGSVGIGLTTPRTRFQVVGLAGSSVPGATGIPSLGFANSSSVALLTNLDPDYGTLFGTLNTGVGWIQQQRADGTATAYNLLLQPNGAGVIVGNSSEFRTDLSNIRFSIHNSSSNPTLSITNTTNGVGQAASIYFGQMINNGTDARPGGSIKSIAVGTYTGGVGTTYSADLAFYTSYQNSDTERMRIISAGFTKISSTNSYAGTSNTAHSIISNTDNDNVLYLIQSHASNPYGPYLWFQNASPNNTTNYFIGCGDATQTKFYVYSNGNVVNRNNSYGTLSDIRLKENIVDATPKLDDILKLKVRNFNLIGFEEKQIGFIAQEFEEVFPKMVENTVDKDTKEEHKTIKTTVLIPILVKAIQELSAKVTALENK